MSVTVERQSVIIATVKAAFCIHMVVPGRFCSFRPLELIISGIIFYISVVPNIFHFSCKVCVVLNFCCLWSILCSNGTGLLWSWEYFLGYLSTSLTCFLLLVVDSICDVQWSFLLFPILSFGTSRQPCPCSRYLVGARRVYPPKRCTVSSSYSCYRNFCLFQSLRDVQD